MKPTRPTHPASNRHRQIGRKVLQADRLSHAMSTATPKKAGFAWPSFLKRPKLVALICFAVISISALGYGVAQHYSAQAAAAEKTAAAKRQSELEAQRIAADACRRKKVEEKAELIGKVTYDELYDYDECDK